MIREPTVGMRVRFNGTGGRDEISIGDTGVITRVDPGSSHKVQMDKEDDYHFAWPKDLTEIKENDMKKGDLVTITNDNHSLLMGAYFNSHKISTTNKFEVIGLPEGIWGNEGDKWHNIILKNESTGNIWLHSKIYCKKVVEVKEISPEQMMAACEEKYGGKVKITKK